MLRILLLVCIIALLIGCRGHSSPRPTPTELVVSDSFLPLPSATRYPTFVPAPTATPTIDITGIRACAASDLEVTYDGSGGLNAGAIGQYFVFSNASPSTCVLALAGVELTDAAGATIVKCGDGSRYNVCLGKLAFVRLTLVPTREPITPGRNPPRGQAMLTMAVRRSEVVSGGCNTALTD